MKTNEHNTKETNAKVHREGLSELTWGLGDREGEGCVLFFYWTSSSWGKTVVAFIHLCVHLVLRTLPLTQS